MSLLEAFLLDPVRTNIWIAVPLMHQQCKTVAYFDNRDMAGNLIRGALTSSGTLLQLWPDPVMVSEDAATLSLF